MEREEEKPKAFKVDDRRRFSSEGDLKPEFREGAESAPAEESQPQAAQASASGAAAEVGGAAARSAAVAPAAHADPREHSSGHLEHPDDPHHSDHAGHVHEGARVAEITFGTFLVGLSTQALMHLGDIPDPQSRQPEQDLEAAQQLIDIIGMLEQKTRGNLDREEAQLIDAILYELRMKYVEQARTAR